MSGSTLGSSAQIPADTAVQGNLQVNGQGTSKVQGGLTVGLPGGTLDVFRVEGNSVVTGTSQVTGTTQFIGRISAIGGVNAGFVVPSGGDVNVGPLGIVSTGPVVSTTGLASATTLQIPTNPGNTTANVVVLVGTNLDQTPPVLTKCTGFVRLIANSDSTSTDPLNAWQGVADITTLLQAPLFAGVDVKFFLTSTSISSLQLNFAGQVGAIGAKLVVQVYPSGTKSLMYVNMRGQLGLTAPASIIGNYIDLQYMIVA